MINIYDEINDLVDYAVKKNLIDKRDKIYAINKLLEVLHLDDFKDIKHKKEERTLDNILENIKEWAVLNNLVENDSIDLLDLFDTKLISQLIKMPSEIEQEFYNHYKNSPIDSTDYFYEFSKNTNYIRENRITKDIRWKYETQYGNLDITINLSKPEKDPRAIAKGRNTVSSNYPKCQLCKENEGYPGRINHPARGNHRVISIDLADEQWYFQYSPYVYYNEHCIVFKENHVPMKITKMTFKRLLGFVQKFPHYFLGSNADLPIVGGSILSHDHFQGGNYSFAMDRAKEENHVWLKNDVEVCTLKWPMSVIRLKGKNVDNLEETAYEIFLKWKNYSDEEVLVLSHTNDEEHNTITPICRYRNGFYELDLVLRNNRTTEKKPYGIFHPREEYHHIKKENIGLIEVMGLAVLPSRLKKEIELLKLHLINNDINSVKNSDQLNKHYIWSKMLMEKYNFTFDNINSILNNEVAEVFLNVLKDAGMFKDNKQGKKAFTKFINTIIK